MKITMYELLGLVKDGKAPKKFKYDSYVWTYNYESSAYWNRKGIEFEDYMDDGLMKYLNDEVEILEEEKKIPEKLKELGIKYSLDYIDYKNIETLKKWLNKDFQTIYDTLDLIIKNQNEIIDYLKSKGE